MLYVAVKITRQYYITFRVQAVFLLVTKWLYLHQFESLKINIAFMMMVDLVGKGVLACGKV